MTYTRCNCGGDCYNFFSQELYGPCWGDVNAIDEQQLGDGEYYWVHSCEGHSDMWLDGDYVEQDLTEDE